MDASSKLDMKALKALHLNGNPFGKEGVFPLKAAFGPHKVVALLLHGQCFALCRPSCSRWMPNHSVVLCSPRCVWAHRWSCKHMSPSHRTRAFAGNIDRGDE